MTKIRILVLLISAAGIGILAGWVAKEMSTPSPSPHPGPISQIRERKAATRNKPLSASASDEANKEALSIAQMNAEASKAWHTDHTYMTRMWFGGDQQRINRVNDIIRKDFSEFPRREEAREAKRRFLEARTDDEKRLYYHEWTQARLYEMIRELEVAKNEDLLARPGSQALSPRNETSAAANPAASPPPAQPEKAPDKLYQ